MDKYWYMVTKKQGEGGLFSLFYAELTSMVRARLDDLGQDGQITKLTERGLAELVGHYPNEVHEPSDLATGAIILNHGGRIIIIHG